MVKKSQQSAQQNPAIRLSSLGPRLENLFAVSSSDAHTLFRELDRLTQGLKPASFLPLLVGALAATPETQRAILGQPLSEWLRERGLLEPLQTLESRRTFKEPDRSVARDLLAAGGVSLAPDVAVNPADLFLAAYEFGETSQDSPTMFWYEDERRRRVCSASFLVDFEPPWEGALKDVAFARHRNLDEGLSEYRLQWRLSELEPIPIDAATLAQRVWQALRQNQAQGIRLPADFIAVLPQIMPLLSALPIASGAAPLSATEIDSLTTTGRSAESIRMEERRFGFQTRLPDGSVIRVMPPPGEEPWGGE
jgi:hypothetical protein